MTDVLFSFDIESTPQNVLAALKTNEGIRGFWTSRAEVPTEVGGTFELGFAQAPAPFDLRLEQSDDQTVAWRTETFPPHWVGSTIRWDVAANEGGATVDFRHVDLPDEKAAGHAAYTWGQIMVRLKEYAESGAVNPVFV